MTFLWLTALNKTNSEFELIQIWDLDKRECVSHSANFQELEINFQNETKDIPKVKIDRSTTIGLPTFCQEATIRRRIVRKYKTKLSLATTVELVDEKKNHVYESNQFCFDHVTGANVSSTMNCKSRNVLFYNTIYS